MTSLTTKSGRMAPLYKGLQGVPASLTDKAKNLAAPPGGQYWIGVNTRHGNLPDMLYQSLGYGRQRSVSHDDQSDRWQVKGDQKFQGLDETLLCEIVSHRSSHQRDRTLIANKADLREKGCAFHDIVRSLKAHSQKLLLKLDSQRGPRWRHHKAQTRQILP